MGGRPRDVANRWDRYAEEARARGEEPTWRDDEAETLRIRHEINGARDAESLAVALEAVEAWRSAWLEGLTPGAKSFGGIQPATNQAQLGRLEELEHDAIQREGQADPRHAQDGDTEGVMP